MSDRTLYSYESSRGWYQRAMRNPVSFHKVFKVDNYDQADIERHWGLAFIDHSPDWRRHVEVKRLAYLADYIVIHDTNPEFDGLKTKKGYKYSKIWPLFKYRYDFTKYFPSTSVVSNFYSLEKFVI